MPLPASGVNASLSVVTRSASWPNRAPGAADLDVEHIASGRVLDGPRDACGPRRFRRRPAATFTGIPTRPVEPLHEHEYSYLPAAVNRKAYSVPGLMEAPNRPMPDSVGDRPGTWSPELTNRTVPPWTGFEAIGLNALSVIVTLYFGAMVRFTVATLLFVLPSFTRKVNESAPDVVGGRRERAVRRRCPPTASHGPEASRSCR